MRDAISGAPICVCGQVYPVPPLLRDPIDTAARAAGWRIFTGRTYGGRQLDTAMCPACAAPTAAPDVPVADTTEQDPLFMHLPRTTAARVGIVAMLAVLATLLVGAAAFGSAADHDRSIGQIRVVEPCTAGQAHANQGRGALGEHGDAFYRCRETAPGCFQWKWQYDGRPKSGHTWSPRPCPACSPSPSKSPSTSPAAPQSTPASTSAHPSPSSSKSPSAAASPPESPRPPAVSSVPVPVADQLPVTGVPTVVFGIAATGLLLIIVGAVLLIVPFRRRRT
jgi:hypothetical protein